MQHTTRQTADSAPSADVLLPSNKLLQPPALSSSVLRCSLITLNARPPSCRCVPIDTSRSLYYAPCFKEYPNRLNSWGESNNETRIKGCSALSNLTNGYDNTIPRLAYPELVDAILNVIQADTGEARRKAWSSDSLEFATEMKSQVPVRSSAMNAALNCTTTEPNSASTIGGTSRWHIAGVGAKSDWRRRNYQVLVRPVLSALRLWLFSRSR